MKRVLVVRFIVRRFRIREGSKRFVRKREDLVKG